MGGRPYHRAVLTTLPLWLVLALVPPAVAHCDWTQGNIAQAGPVVVTRCLVQEALEGNVEAINAQLDGQMAIVVIKDFRFHPDTVTIRQGGTVLWVWADVQGSEQHDPRSSTTCGSQALDLALCNPFKVLRWGKCFDVIPDTGSSMKDLGDVYPVTFRYTESSGTLQKSHGVLSGTAVVGEPPLAPPFKNCDPDTLTPVPGTDAVVPYHCGFHGRPDDTGGADGLMRGAVIVEA